jgi:hypothetical protein
MGRLEGAALLGLAVAALSGAAAAEQFVVVKSTSAEIHRGQVFDSGDHISLGAGQTLTLIRASGEVLVLNGRAGGIAAPGGGASDHAERDHWRLEALKALAMPATARPEVGASRGFCPEPQELQTLSIIVRANESGCTAEAAAAFDAYLAREAKPAG